MKSLYACIDIDHPVVAWACYIGVLCSARAGHQYPHCPVSIMLAGILKDRNSIRLQNELIIEEARQRAFPDKISRLTGMFFFEEKGAIDYAWRWGRHFSNDYLAEVGVLPYSRLSKHDSNWITFAPLDESGALKSSGWCKSYWSGEPFPGKKPVWEIIIDGRVAIFGTELRQRAYENTKKAFPDCLAILEIGRIGAELGSNIGQARARFIQHTDKDYAIRYFMEMQDANNPDYLKILKEYRGPKNFDDLAIGGDSFTVPDFRDFGENFSLDEPFSKNLFTGIHENQT